MSKDNLGERMKGYEHINRNFLTRRTPTIIRLDGKAFHTFTKGFKRPFDELLIQTMQETAKYLCENIQGCRLAYTQSDEISLLLTDYEKITTDAWFGKNIQKMVSISASMATLAFNNIFNEKIQEFETKIRQLPNNSTKYNRMTEMLDVYKHVQMTAMFDSRVFNLPKEEVNNYFLWRQQDCTRNSIQMVGQSEFSHKQLHNLTCNQIQDKLFLEKQINYNNYPTHQKRGTCVIKQQVQRDIKVNNKLVSVTRSQWFIDKEIPIFSKNPTYININLIASNQHHDDNITQ